MLGENIKSAATSGRGRMGRVEEQKALVQELEQRSSVLLTGALRNEGHYLYFKKSK